MGNTQRETAVAGLAGSGKCVLDQSGERLRARSWKTLSWFWMVREESCVQGQLLACLFKSIQSCGLRRVIHQFLAPRRLLIETRLIYRAGCVQQPRVAVEH